MNITRWYASKLGVQNLPSIRVVKAHRQGIMDLAGSHPRVHRSQLGNIYCKTTIASILSHVCCFYDNMILLYLIIPFLLLLGISKS